MRILALDAALARCSAAIVAGDQIVAQRQRAGDRGQAMLLPVMVDEVIAEAAMAAGALDLVAVTVGPGSFTGIRAGLALAHGIGLAASVPVIGVSVGEVLAEALPHLGTRTLWSAIDSRRDRVFLEISGSIETFALDALPMPDSPVAIAGDAAIEVATRLAARNADVMLTDARWPQVRHVALAARRRHDGSLPPLAAQPLYVDPPEARLQTALRPPPSA